MRDVLERQYGPLNLFFSTNNMDAVRKAVYENLAATIGPDYTVKYDPFVASGDVIPLPIEDVDHDYPGMALIWSKAKSNTSFAVSFLARLESVLINSM